jgi:hypothetical protein
MFRRGTTALALLSALTGCVAAPPKGRFVEYHEGLTPITHPVRCEATYALHAAGAAEPLTAHHLGRGERIGFRREADGSVSAVGPGQVLALEPGEYWWAVVPGTVAPWRKRLGAEISPAVPGAAFLADVGLVLGALFLCVLAGAADDNDSDSKSDTKPPAPPAPAPAPQRTGTRVP